MPDIAAITAILSGVKTATEITKNLRDVDVNLQKAELKLKLAELMEALADVRMEAAEVNDAIAAKDAKILELESALQLKMEVVRDRDGIYKAVDGQPQGRPMCARCWDVDHKLYYLSINPKDGRISECKVCRAQYDSWGLPKHPV